MEEQSNLDSRGHQFSPSPGKTNSPLTTPRERTILPAIPRINIPRVPVSTSPKPIIRRQLTFSQLSTSLDQSFSDEESVRTVFSSKPQRGRPSAKDLQVLHKLGAASKFKCSDCPMGFQRKKSLATHMLTHRAEKKHDCSYPECKKRFTQYSHLTTHWRVHTREKPFICTAKNCTTRSTFKRGKCLHHPGSLFTRQNETTDAIMEKLTSNQENMSEAEVTWIIEHLIKKRDGNGNLDVFTGAKNLMFYINRCHEKAHNARLYC